MLTHATEYALRALARLAEAPGEWREVGQVSRSLDIPSNYLSKIMGQLARLGVLESRKGRGGGFRIKADPK
ncbi:MAG: Rrf2 family transcriptional regulator, partial [Gemmatimonadales bacterium]